MRLDSDATGSVYRAAPSGQPPHAFPLVECGPTWATFADPEHDFPQSLTYRRTEDGLTATVEGGTGAERRRERWDWTLVP